MSLPNESTCNESNVGGEFHACLMLTYLIAL
jgi:hypothetical protein